MSAQATNFEKYKESLKQEALEREEWQIDASLGKAVSMFTGLGSLFLFFFALYKSKKYSTLGPAAALAAASTTLASREISIISDNMKTILESTKRNQAPKLITAPVELSKAMFKDTWVSDYLFRSYYTRWLNQKDDF